MNKQKEAKLKSLLALLKANTLNLEVKTYLLDQKIKYIKGEL
jgi:hypothetical protein